MSDSTLPLVLQAGGRTRCGACVPLPRRDLGVRVLCTKAVCCLSSDNGQLGPDEPVTKTEVPSAEPPKPLSTVTTDSAEEP